MEAFRDLLFSPIVASSVMAASVTAFALLIQSWLLSCRESKARKDEFTQQIKLSRQTRIREVTANALAVSFELYLLTERGLPDGLPSSMEISSPEFRSELSAAKTEMAKARAEVLLLGSEELHELYETIWISHRKMEFGVTRDVAKGAEGSEDWFSATEKFAETANAFALVTT